MEDEKVLSAFYYALQDTLVTENIEKATRISMSGGKRWRTVTLKGEVVEVSGAMSGGGNTQKRHLILGNNFIFLKILGDELDKPLK